MHAYTIQKKGGGMVADRQGKGARPQLWQRDTQNSTGLSAGSGRVTHHQQEHVGA